MRKAKLKEKSVTDLGEGLLRYRSEQTRPEELGEPLKEDQERKRKQSLMVDQVARKLDHGALYPERNLPQ